MKAADSDFLMKTDYAHPISEKWGDIAVKPDSYGDSHRLSNNKSRYSYLTKKKPGIKLRVNLKIESGSSLLSDKQHHSAEVPRKSMIKEI